MNQPQVNKGETVNLFKTGLLLTIMTMLFMGVGFLLAGETGMIIALLLAAGMNLFSWWNSGNMVLRMHNAHEVDEHSAPELYNMVRDLAANAKLPMPKVYVIETDQPNAFATGRNAENAAVAASAGLLDRMSAEEVAGVMAHELAHIKNRDMLTMTIAATFAGAIGMLANFAMFFRGGRNSPMGIVGVIATMFIAPLAASIVQMAVSRTREYAADRLGAEICGNPLWLASALEKIAIYAGRTVNHQAENAPATAHLFIINPLNGQNMDNLFSTHPDTGNRIEALNRMAQEWQAEETSTEDRTEIVQEREIWGRNAGKMRDIGHHEQENRSGPWNEASQNPTDQKGPWD